MPRHGLPLLKDRQKNKSFNNSIRDVCENPQLVELLSWAEEGENFAQALWGRSSLYQNQIDKRCGTQPQLIFIINHGRPCLFVRFGHLILVPVMPRRGSYFFLLVQAKVTKKKDTPLTAPSKSAGGPLRCSPCRAAAAYDLSCPYGHKKSESPCGKLALRAQTVLADFPLHGCATRRCTGAPKKTTSTPVKP